MKRLICTICISLNILLSQAQTDVYFKIDHFLGNSAFAYNATASNNLGNTFKVSRLEYYIAEIRLIHDGGQISKPDSTWLLVEGTKNVNEFIGNYNITSLEAIQFTVGVEAAVNHNDPTAYPPVHPLAPKMPSMHWGWAAGYRFVALEGKAGNNFAQIFELHGLGDANYYPLTLTTSGIKNGNTLEVQVNADIEKAIANIDVSSGLVSHGATGEAKTCLINFNQQVFTSVEGNNSVSLAELSSINWNVYPNPSTGKVFIDISNNSSSKIEVQVSNMLGKIILSETYADGEVLEINLQDSGVYFMSIRNENGSIQKTKKLIISK